MRHSKRTAPGARVGDEGAGIGERRARVEVEEVAGVLGAVGRAPGEALEEDGAEGVEIGAAVDRPREHPPLLRGGVEEGADRLAAEDLAAVAVGEAEVDEARLAGGVEEDVGGLEIAVDDVMAVDRAEGLGEGEAEADDLGLGERAALEAAGEGAAEELHHDVGDAVGAADVEDPRDRDLAEAREVGGLSEEARGHRRARRAVARVVDLDGDRLTAAEPGEDEAGRAAADRLDELDARYREREGHGGEGGPAYHRWREGPSAPKRRRSQRAVGPACADAVADAVCGPCGRSPGDGARPCGRWERGAATVRRVVRARRRRRRRCRRCRR